MIQLTSRQRNALKEIKDKLCANLPVVMWYSMDGTPRKCYGFAVESRTNKFINFILDNGEYSDDPTNLIITAKTEREGLQNLVLRYKARFGKLP